MNIELAKKVLAHIKANPNHFNMNEGMTIEPSIARRCRPNFPCGTVACIAGWTVLLHDCQDGKQSDIADYICGTYWSFIEQRAQELLEIDDEIANWLFYAGTPYFSFQENNQIAISKLEDLIDTFSPLENTSQNKSTVKS